MRIFAAILVLAAAWIICSESEILYAFAPIIGFGLIPVIGTILRP